MLYESWETVKAQARIANGEDYRATLTPSGFWVNDPPPNRTQRRLFRNIEEQYVTITWFPRPERRFSLVREDGTDNKLGQKALDSLGIDGRRWNAVGDLAAKRFRQEHQDGFEEDDLMQAVYEARMNAILESMGGKKLGG